MIFPAIGVKGFPEGEAQQPSPDLEKGKKTKRAGGIGQSDQVRKKGDLEGGMVQKHTWVPPELRVPLQKQAGQGQAPA